MLRFCTLLSQFVNLVKYRVEKQKQASLPLPLLGFVFCLCFPPAKKLLFVLFQVVELLSLSFFFFSPPRFFSFSFFFPLL